MNTDATAGAAPATSWRLGRPGVMAAVMLVAAGVGIVQSEVIAAALLCGVVVGFGLSGSV